MAVQVGGVNIGLGVNLNQVMTGFKKAQSMLANFQRDMKNIRLEGVITGDPFKATNDYMRKSRLTLNQVFKEWREDILYVKEVMDDFAISSRQNTEKMIKGYDKLKSQLDLLKKSSKVLSFKEGGAGYGVDFSSAAGVDVATLRKSLLSLKGFGKETEKLIRKTANDVRTGKIKTRDELKKYFDDIRAVINVKGKKIVKDYEKFGLELEKSFKLQKGLDFKAQLKSATDETKILAKRKEALQKLLIAEKKLRVEKKLGINTDTFRVNLMKIYADRQRLGRKLTNEQTIALKKFRKEQEKAAQGTGLFTKEWFRVRAKWFVELRLLWAIYRNVIDAVRDLINYEVQLSRALRTARSNIKSNLEITRAYGDAMREAVVIHGTGWDKLGEVLYQLGSAGLSAEESMAGLNSTMSLIVGTEGDARETTKAIAGIYNNFKDTITEVSGAEEKLAYINDLVAVAWKNHQVEISELTEGYRRSSAMAKVAGVNIRELTALLAVANDHMIKGGRAGRSLASVWSRLSKQPRTFAKVFGVDIDANEPLKFMDVMKQLAESFKIGQLSVNELGEAFRRLGLRGAPTFVTLLENWNEVTDAVSEFGDVAGEAAELESKRLDNLEGNWKRFLGNLRSYVSRAEGLLDQISTALKFWAEVLGGFNKSILQEKFLESFYFPNTDILNKKAVENMTKSQIKALKEMKKRLEKNSDIVAGEVFINLEDNEKVIGRINKILEETKKHTEKITKNTEEEVKARKHVAGEHEREFYFLSSKDKESYNRLKYLRQELKIQKGIVESARKDAESAKKKKLSDIDIEATYKAAEEQQKKLLKIKKDIDSIENKINRETRKGLTDQLNLYKDQEQIQIKIIDAEIKAKGKRITKEDQEEINGLLKERLIHSNNISKIEEKLSNIAGKDVQIAADNLELSIQQNKETDKNKKITTDRIVLQTQLNDLIDKYNKKLDTKKYEVELAKINHATNSKLLELQKESLEIELESLRKQKEKTEYAKDDAYRTKQLYVLNGKIRDKRLKILQIDEKINRENSIIYNWTQNLKDKTREWHSIAVDVLTTFTTGFATGLGTTFANMTGGFQEQQQEAENLKGELADLKDEYSDAVSDGDIERTKELTDQIAELESQIKDLEDPINNLKEQFLDFFKSLIDNIRQVVSEWLAMQLVMGILGAVIPTSKPINTNIGGPVTYAKTGAVLPNIKAFKSFGTGGITSNPTLALLGDNMSKKEIVIPTENIKPNNVSGYMREQEQPVFYIINTITESEFSQAMGKASGQKVIVNSVLKNKELISKAIRI